ncbi:MAG: eukaryotic-like serine/threonine-protein kinase [Chloroflexota bacterium]|jgi:serine/threonine-protein kinase|nr:eukaryotic-like serine/threonine-protein kinase [Chloroflexota bacterium]
MHGRVELLQPGDILDGRYLVEGLLGAGGMARLYHAFDQQDELYVALKVLLPEHTALPGFLERFRREGEALSRLDHPHILRCFNAGTDSERALQYLVLEYLPGGSLQERLDGRPWSLARAIAVLRPIAEALDYAHAAAVPIIHRDLKPSNILFDDADRPLISDFGIARLGAAERRVAGSTDLRELTQPGLVLGTPAYMAPEQVLGQTASSAADRYALGVIAYEMLTGRAPFQGETADATRQQVIAAPLPQPRTLNPALDEGVELVIVRALAREPATRYPTAVAFIDALAALEQPTLSAAALMRNVAFATGRTGRRALVVAIVLFLFLSGTVVAMRSGGAGVPKSSGPESFVSPIGEFSGPAPLASIPTPTPSACDALGGSVAEANAALQVNDVRRAHEALTAADDCPAAGFGASNDVLNRLVEMADADDWVAALVLAPSMDSADLDPRLPGLRTAAASVFTAIGQAARADGVPREAHMLCTRALELDPVSREAAGCILQTRPSPTLLPTIQPTATPPASPASRTSAAPPTSIPTYTPEPALPTTVPEPRATATRVPPPTSDRARPADPNAPIRSPEG